MNEDFLPKIIGKVQLSCTHAHAHRNLSSISLLLQTQTSSSTTWTVLMTSAALVRKLRVTTHWRLNLYQTFISYIWTYGTRGHSLIVTTGLSLTDAPSEVSGPDHRPQEDKHQPRRGETYPTWIFFNAHVSGFIWFCSIWSLNVRCTRGVTRWFGAQWRWRWHIFFFFHTRQQVATEHRWHPTPQRQKAASRGWEEHINVGPVWSRQLYLSVWIQRISFFERRDQLVVWKLKLKRFNDHNLQFLCVNLSSDWSLD